MKDTMNTRLLPIAVLALCAAACTNDTENLNDGPVAAQFTAAIGDNVTATTRVSGTDGTEWDEDDCIGITGGSYSNVPYVTNNGDGNFDPASDYIYFDNTDEVTFHAYYPYKDDDEMTEGKIAATTDAKAQEVQTRHDFLFASGAKGTTSYTLKGLLLQGTFDPTTGQTATTTTTTADVTLPGSLTSSIFFPQTVSEIEMEILLNGNTYNATLPVKEDKLQSGKEYHYEITISHKGVEVDASIKQWEKVEDDITVGL